MYVEFYSDAQVLQTALQDGSEASVDIRDLATTDDIPLRIICVARGEQLDEFKHALRNDPTVANVEQLNTGEDRRLYRIVTTPGTAFERAYDRMVARDGVYLNSQNTDDSWYNKMNFPDKEAFRQFQTEVSDFMNVQPTVMRDGRFFLTQESFGLTAKQQEVIAEAVKTGYFEVPKRASLSDVAGRIDISDQAASERLRRGMKTMAENSVAYYPSDVS